MDKAIYNQVRLFDEETTYEEGKRILTSINATLNTVMDIGEPSGEDGDD